MVVAASTAVTPAAETSAPSVLRSTRDLAVGAACTAFIAATGGISRRGGPAARRPAS